MAMSSRLLGAIGVCLLTAGCAPVDPGMGEAVKYDMLAQTVNPDPVYPANGALPGGSGDRGVKASERYRKGTVKAIERERTGSSSGGGGGSSSSSSGGGS
jgi:uncharacterized membrane protein YgcG